MKPAIGISMIAGVATLGYVASDPHHALLAWIAAFTMLAVTGVAGLVLVFVLELVNAKWWLAVRAPFVACASLVVIAPLFFVPIALFGRAIYSQYSVGFLARSAVCLGAWALLGVLAKRGSRTVAAVGLPILACTLTVAASDWLVALQPSWTSSLFGLWMFGEGFAGAMAAVAVGAWAAARAGLLDEGVVPDHFHAIGRLLLCGLLVWAYLGFFELLLVWLPDLPREITFFVARSSGAWAVVDVIVVARFVLAFLVLLSREAKRSPRVLAGLGAFLLATEALDCAWLVLPSVNARLSPLDALPFLAVIASAWAWAARVATRLPPPAELRAALRYRSP